MNISFLSSTGTFFGAQYNFKKVDLNQADLLEAQNFKGLKHLGEVKAKDYIDYLKAWSERNSRVKNPQLHVAISVRGREKTDQELLKISKEWLSGMGYSDVPALFFFHRDTDNNHIHIVASRIGPDGKKIPDSNEIRRGLALLRQLNGVELSAQAKVDLSRLEGYQLASKTQYSVLWRSLGYRTKTTPEGVSLYKGGVHVMSVSEEAIRNQVVEDVLTKEKASSIREVFARNKGDLNIDDFNRVLKDRYGLELMLSGKPESPTGYSIIDHREQKMYKGSEVYPLDKLLSEARIFSDRDQVDRVNAFARRMMADGRLTSQELRDIVKTWGLSIYRGEISYKRIVIGELAQDVQERLWYNDRLEKASEVEVHNLRELEAVAKYYKVNALDIAPSGVSEEQDNRRDLGLLYEQALHSDDFWGALREEEVGYVSHQGHVYLIDLKDGNLEELQGYTSERRLEAEREQEGDLIDSEALSSLLGLDAYDDIEASSMDNSLKKRRRR